MEMQERIKRTKIKKELRKMRESVCKRRGEKFLEMFKWWDSYGQPVLLTYEGEETFKTIPGALMSYLILLIMLLYAAQQGILLVTRGGAAVTMTMAYSNLNVTPPLIPNEFGFDIAIGLKDYDIPP